MADKAYRSVSALLVLLVLAIGISRVQAKTRVALELVLALDISSSVDEAEFELQRQGLANAFLHRDVINAIHAVGGIAVSVVYWAGNTQQANVVEWMAVGDEVSAAKLAVKIASSPRIFAGLTDISGAINYSVELLENNDFDGRRRAIDVSGDGTSDALRDRLARDNAVARDLTINGLVILNEDYDLAELANINIRNHYANNVIGGKGAFMMSARDFEDFHVAIRRKLVREIFGPNIALLAK